MKRLDRYLFFSLLRPFIGCLLAFTALLVVADLFGSLDDFVSHKAKLREVLAYYSVFLPEILILVLPTTLLFAALYSLLILSRNSELVALQAAGLSLSRLYRPFAVLGLTCTAILYLITLTWGGSAKSRREAIMSEIRGNKSEVGVKRHHVYQEPRSQRLWFIGSLNAPTQRADNIEVIDPSPSGSRKLVASYALWDGTHWTLHEGQWLIFDTEGNLLRKEPFSILPCPLWKESPEQVLGLQTKAQELSFAELSSLLTRATLYPARSLAPYQTQYYYYLLYPWTACAMLLIALASGHAHHRRRAAGGVFNAIFVLIAFLMILHTSLALGRSARIPALLAVLLPLALFFSYGAFRLAVQSGWRVPYLNHDLISFLKTSPKQALQ
jgi:lipopolysaccharide export system permease protein